MMIVMGFYLLGSDRTKWTTHKKKSCPFTLPKFTKFLVKWDKIDEYATCIILVTKD